MPEPIKDRKIRIAIAGCGRISKSHFGAVETHSDNLELAAVCEKDKDILRAHEKQYGVPGYSSLEEMLDSEKLDLVSLCTPSGMHPAETIMAARKKVHVMTEKPMATRWKDALEMVRVCDEEDVHLLEVKQNRRNSTLQFLKGAAIWR